MNNKRHLSDIAPLFGAQFVSDWRLVTEFFKDYSQTILDDKTYVLQCANGVEVRVSILIRPKVVFFRLETPPPAFKPDDKDDCDAENQFETWYLQLFDDATRTAGIRPSSVELISTPHCTILYEPKVMWTGEMEKSEQKDGKV